MSKAKKFPHSVNVTEGNEKILVIYDWPTRTVQIHLGSRAKFSDFIEFTPEGQRTVEETEPTRPYMTFSEDFLRMYPGLLPGLHAALGDFLGEPNQVEISRQHLSDMKVIVEKTLGVEFKNANIS